MPPFLTASSRVFVALTFACAWSTVAWSCACWAGLPPRVSRASWPWAAATAAFAAWLAASAVALAAPQAVLFFEIGTLGPRVAVAHGWATPGASAAGWGLGPGA